MDNDCVNSERMSILMKASSAGVTADLAPKTQKHTRVRGTGYRTFTHMVLEVRYWYNTYSVEVVRCACAVIELTN